MTSAGAVASESPAQNAKWTAQPVKARLGTRIIRISSAAEKHQTVSSVSTVSTAYAETPPGR
jgi:hypothetical protein